MLLYGRKYTAVVDNGHDTFEYNYISNHRNHSAENRYDLRMAMILTLGQHSRKYKILDTFRNDWTN